MCTAVRGSDVCDRTAATGIAAMGVVLLSTPCSRISPGAFVPVRLTTEARVQHKAVKLMTKRRPKKVRHGALQRHHTRPSLRAVSGKFGADDSLNGSWFGASRRTVVLGRHSGARQHGAVTPHAPVAAEWRPKRASHLRVWMTSQPKSASVSSQLLTLGCMRCS